VGHPDFPCQSPPNQSIREISAIIFLYSVTETVVHVLGHIIILYSMVAIIKKVCVSHQYFSGRMVAPPSGIVSLVDKLGTRTYGEIHDLA
jgi:hypothetical protein